MGEGTIANQSQNVRSHIEGRLLTVAWDVGVKGIKVCTNKGPFFLKNIGGPHVILKIYKIYPNTKVHVYIVYIV